MPFVAKWMDLELITLNEVLQVRERQISHDITYSGIVMIRMNLFTRQKYTHRLCQQTYGYRRGKEGEGNI